MRRKVESRQIRAARGLLDWTQSMLAERSGLGLQTIKRVEDETIGVSELSLDAVVRSLEEAGMVFLDGADIVPDPGCGVALRSSGRRRGRPRRGT